MGSEQFGVYSHDKIILFECHKLSPISNGEQRQSKKRKNKINSKL